STKLIPLPAPQCVVFYNGTKDCPDKQTLHLSDAFVDETGTHHDACMDLTVKIYNINYGHNGELMSCCRRLEEYSLFINKVKEYRQFGYSADNAVDRAVAWCIDNDIMADILGPHRAEVKKMLLTYYNEKKTMRLLQKEAREEAIKEGREEGIRVLIKVCHSLNVSQEDTCTKLMEEFRISETEAEKYIAVYWDASHKNT
ncbi:MAG: hypothetical protein ACI4TB_10590, partial [Lachnospiraceae bacterium]